MTVAAIGDDTREWDIGIRLDDCLADTRQHTDAHTHIRAHNLIYTVPNERLCHV